MNPEMMEALQALAVDRQIAVETLFNALAEAMTAAYQKRPDAHQFSWVDIDTETGDIRVFAQELDDDGEPHGEEMDVTPDDFGRIAAQTTRQVMSQRIRQAERDLKYEEYAGREGEIITGIIQQSDSRYTLLDLGRAEALLPQSEQVNYERPDPGDRVKAYIVEVRNSPKGPQIVVSRTHPGLIRRLFELEVPEIAEGIVEIKACAREPGQRTKIAVWSNDSNIDPVGACVGARGARVRMVVNELRGEKIDIVPFSDDPNDFVMKALQPAKVKEVRIDHAAGSAEVIVPDFQLSLAIGKEGQNARLASRLTGLRVDIRSETDIAQEEAYKREYGGDSWAEGEWREVDGVNMWYPADGSAPVTQEAVESASTSGDEDDTDQPAADQDSEESVTEALNVDVAESVEEATEAIAADEIDEQEAELQELSTDEDASGEDADSDGAPDGVVREDAPIVGAPGSDVEEGAAVEAAPVDDSFEAAAEEGSAEQDSTESGSPREDGVD